MQVVSMIQHAIESIEKWVAKTAAVSVLVERAYFLLRNNLCRRFQWLFFVSQEKILMTDWLFTNMFFFLVFFSESGRRSLEKVLNIYKKWLLNEFLFHHLHRHPVLLDPKSLTTPTWYLWVNERQFTQAGKPKSSNKRHLRKLYQWVKRLSLIEEDYDLKNIGAKLVMHHDWFWVASIWVLFVLVLCTGLTSFSDVITSVSLLWARFIAAPNAGYHDVHEADEKLYIRCSTGT